MNHKCVFWVLVGFCLVFTSGFGLRRVKAHNDLALSLKASEASYKTGEVVTLNFQLKNQGSRVILVGDKFGIAGGYLDVYASNDAKNYRKYWNPGGQVEYVTPLVTTLKPGTSVFTSTTVLWNWEGDDNAEYFFSSPGEYYVKASYMIPSSPGSPPLIIESQPIKILITEPSGEDLEVWKSIRDRPDFAYFFQYNDVRIPSYKPEEREKFLNEIERIISQHPNSFYAGMLSDSLSKFRAAEARRTEMLEKLRGKPNI